MYVKYKVRKWFKEFLQRNEAHIGWYASAKLDVTVYDREKSFDLQFHGFEVCLYPDGTYILTDTSGG